MSKYERAQREAERKRRQEEWEAEQERRENEAIDVEDLKQQEDMKQGNYLKMSILGDLNIDPKKHKAQQKQGKIRNIAEQGATPGEQAAGQSKLKDKTILPNLYQMGGGTPLQKQDAIDNQEFDRALNPDGTFKKPTLQQLKDGVKIKKVWEDTKEFKHWSNLPHNIGAVGARGVESFFTIDADNPKEVAFELLQKVGNPRKGLAGEIIGEIPGVKVAIRQIKKEAFDFAKRILPNGYDNLRYALAGGGELTQDATKALTSQKDDLIKTKMLMSGAREASSYSDMHWANTRGSSLHPGGPTGRFPRGESRKLTAELTTGIKPTPALEAKFKKQGINIKKAIEERIQIAFGKEDIHHKGILRQIWESMNGLDYDHVTKSRRYYQRELGFKLGSDISNATPLPELFHPMLHAVMNKRLGGSGGSFTLKNLEKKFNLAKDWKKNTKFPQRKQIYDEVIDTIRNSLKDIDNFWNVLESRTTQLGKIPQDKFVEMTQDLIDLDTKILDAGKTIGRQNPNINTASDVINHILTNAGKVDLSLPRFSKLNPSDLEVVAKAELLNKDIIRESLLSKQSANTVFTAYKDVLGVSRGQFNRILNQINAYLY